jgi:hypothetical protein
LLQPPVLSMLVLNLTRCLQCSGLSGYHYQSTIQSVERFD